jgi:hypothetical protein
LELGEEVHFVQQALVGMDGYDLLPNISSTSLILHLEECGLVNSLINDFSNSGLLLLICLLLFLMLHNLPISQWRETMGFVECSVLFQESNGLSYST